MGYNLLKPFLSLCALCIGIILSGLVLAQSEDQQSQEQTYGAYPGEPTSVASAVGDYPGQQDTASSVTSRQTEAVQVSQSTGTVSGDQLTAESSTQAPPTSQQQVVVSYDVESNPPTAIYYSGTFMPWANFYKSFPAKSPNLWVATSAGWSWYAVCPVGGWIQNLMYVPNSGIMRLYEFYPDGSVQLHSYGFSTRGYKYIWFYADTPGRHMALFTIYDKPSNYIVIDVM